jgi:hypothetical protein
MEQSPEDAAGEFFAAVERGEWERAATFVHPETVSRFRDEMDSRVVEWERPPRTMSADDYLRHEPDMPPEVAEYNAMKSAEWARQQGPELPQFLAHVHEASEVSQLSGVELFARYMEAQDPRYQVRAAYDRAGRPMPEPVSDGSAARLVRTVLGAVMETESTAHVVYRQEWLHEGVPAPHKHLDVMTLERTHAGWRARDFDVSGNGRGVWVSYLVPDEEAEPG